MYIIYGLHSTWQSHYEEIIFRLLQKININYDNLEKGYV